MADKFTEQQLAFIDEYLVSFCATAAAKKAGYSTPGRYGWALKQLPHIKKEIQRRCEQFTKEKAALKERIIQELCALAFTSLSDIGELGPCGLDIKNEIPDFAKRAIQSLDISENDRGVNCKVRLHDKTRALETLAKYIGMHEDNQISVHMQPYVIEKRNGDTLELGAAQKDEKK